MLAFLAIILTILSNEKMFFVLSHKQIDTDFQNSKEQKYSKHLAK